MNKSRFFIGFILLLMVIAAVLAVLVRSRVALQKAPSLVPADTIAFLYLPNAGASADRWKETSLHEMATEPEVKAFLDSALAKVPYIEVIRAKLDEIKAIEPRETFVALTGLEGSEPSIVFGFQYAGRREDVEKLVNEAKGFVKQLTPSGTADLIQEDGTTIETFSEGNRVLASAYHADWFFVANGIDLLKTTLARFEGKSDGESLANAKPYVDSLAQLPQNFESLFFVQPALIVNRLASLFGTAGLTAQQADLEELRKVQALAAITRFEGQNIRDAAFTLVSDMPQQKPLQRYSLRFTTPATLLYYTAALKLPEKQINLPDPSLDRFGILRIFESIKASLAENGLSTDDFLKAFGPEGSLILDWPAEAGEPSGLITFDVRDHALAVKLLDVLNTSGSLGMTFGRTEKEGAVYYVAPEPGFGLQPTLGLSRKFLVIGATTGGVQQALAGNGKGALPASTGFQSATRSLKTPTAAFGYIDSKALFERTYGTARLFLTMSASLMPDANSYVDFTKLPAPESVSRHLGPVALSQTATPDGLLVESVGPVTFNQIVAGGAIGVGAAAIPFLTRQFKEGLSGALQGIPPAVPPPTARPGSVSATPEPTLPPPSTPPPPAPPVAENPAAETPAPAESPAAPPTESPTPAAEEAAEPRAF